MDVVGFGNRHRTNKHQVVVRQGLYRTVRQAFRQSAIPWSRCRVEDRGDGVFILIQPDVPKSSFVEALPRELLRVLREHNDHHVEQERIRLRVALHAGEVNYDQHGVTGASINLAFRLVDSAPVKAVMAETSAQLALVTSSWFFDDVVRHSASANSTGFRPVPVQVKETATTVG